MVRGCSAATQPNGHVPGRRGELLSFKGFAVAMASPEEIYCILSVDESLSGEKARPQPFYQHIRVESTFEVPLKY